MSIRKMFEEYFREFEEKFKKEYFEQITASDSELASLPDLVFDSLFEEFIERRLLEKYKSSTILEWNGLKFIPSYYWKRNFVLCSYRKLSDLAGWLKSNSMKFSLEKGGERRK